MSELIHFGSIYFDENPVPIGSPYGGELISIEDTICGHEIPWIEIGDMLVATKLVCTHISWTQLDTFGFIFGTEVLIDGYRYMCRSLKVGSEDHLPNEWDEILDRLGANALVFDLPKYTFFWGQETPYSSKAYRVCRGGANMRNWSESYATNPKDAGLLPVLERLPIGDYDFEKHLGQKLHLRMPMSGQFTGILKGTSEYDLFFEPTTKCFELRNWGILAPDGLVTIDRKRALDVKVV